MDGRDERGQRLQVGFVAGGALLAGGVVLWLLAPHAKEGSAALATRKPRVEVSPRVGAGVVGLDMRGTF